MRVRAAEERDVDSLIELASDVYLRVPYGYDKKQNWLNFIKEHYSYVVDSGGNIVGHGGLELNYRYYDKDRRYGKLCRSFIHKQFRRLGLYEELTKIRLFDAERAGLQYVDAKAVTYTDVVQRVLIEKFGFVPIGLELNALEGLIQEGVKESLVLLRKRINDSTIMTPSSPAKRKDGCYPFDYGGPWFGGWSYYKIPKEFDFSSLKLHEKVKSFLNLVS